MNVWRLHPPRRPLPCLAIVYSMPTDAKGLEYRLGKLRTYIGQWGLDMIGYFRGPEHVAHAQRWIETNYPNGLALIHIPDDSQLHSSIIAWHERLRVYINAAVDAALVAGHDYLYVEPRPLSVLPDPHEQFLGTYLSISGLDDRVIGLDEAMDMGFLHVGTSARLQSCVMPFDPVVEHDQAVRLELTDLRAEERALLDHLIAAQAQGDELAATSYLYDLQVIAARVRGAEESMFTNAGTRTR